MLTRRQRRRRTSIAIAHLFKLKLKSGQKCHWKNLSNSSTVYTSLVQLYQNVWVGDTIFIIYVNDIFHCLDVDPEVAAGTPLISAKYMYFKNTPKFTKTSSLAAFSQNPDKSLGKCLIFHGNVIEFCFQISVGILH